MKVIEPGHKYQLDVLDGDEPVIITFVNREAIPHSGTQTQEALRASIDVMSVLIDRTNHCDGCLRWEGNDRIIKAMSEAQRQMRLALLIHEERAMERKLDKEGWQPELAQKTSDGHFPIPQSALTFQTLPINHRFRFSLIGDLHKKLDETHCIRLSENNEIIGGPILIDGNEQMHSVVIDIESQIVTVAPATEPQFLYFNQLPINARFKFYKDSRESAYRKVSPTEYIDLNDPDTDVKTLTNYTKVKVIVLVNMIEAAKGLYDNEGTT